jgi:hypothetical protein
LFIIKYTQVRVTLHALDTEDQYDSVAVLARPAAAESDTAFTEIARYSGKVEDVPSARRVVSSHAGHVRLQFTSDGDIPGGSFLLGFEAIVPPAPLPGTVFHCEGRSTVGVLSTARHPEGTFYADGYTNGARCVLTLVGARIRLHLRHLDTEQSQDFLTVYAGTAAHDARFWQIAKYSGSETGYLDSQLTLESRAGAVRLSFAADSNGVSKSGFAVTWEVMHH